MGSTGKTHSETGGMTSPSARRPDGCDGRSCGVIARSYCLWLADRHDSIPECLTRRPPLCQVPLMAAPFIVAGSTGHPGPEVRSATTRRNFVRSCTLRVARLRSGGRADSSGGRWMLTPSSRRPRLSHRRDWCPGMPATASSPESGSPAPSPSARAPASRPSPSGIEKLPPHTHLWLLPRPATPSAAFG
jgi:hypothetical protein